MNEQQQIRLHEFIAGIEQSNQYLGCISTDALTDEFTQELGMPIVETRNTHEGRVLQALLPHLQTGTSCALIIDSNLAGAIRNQLHLIADGTFNAHLPGEESPTVINPIPASAAVFLIPQETSLEELHLQTACVSACNLTT